MPEETLGHPPPGALEPAEARVNQLLRASWKEKEDEIESATAEVVKVAAKRLGTTFSGRWERIPIEEGGLIEEAKRSAPQLVERRTYELKDGTERRIFSLFSKGKTIGEDKNWSSLEKWVDRGRAGLVRRAFFIQLPVDGPPVKEMWAWHVAHDLGEKELKLKEGNAPLQVKKAAEERALQAEKEYEEARRERILAQWKGETSGLFKPS